MPAERYFSISEPGEFLPSGAPTGTMTAGHFESAYSRGAIRNAQGDICSTPPFVDAPSTTHIFVHGLCRVNIGSSSGTTTFFQLLNDLGTVVVRAVETGALTNSYKWQYWNGSAYVDIIPTFSFPNDSLTRFDIEVICGASGEFRLWLNKVLTVEKADGLSAAVNNVAKVNFRHSTDAQSWSQVAGANFDLRDLIVKALPPVSDGTHTAGTGTFADVDEFIPNDAEMVILNAVGDKETFNAIDYTIPPGISVDSFWVVGRARAATNDMRWILRSGGNDYASSELNADSGFSPYARYWANDPATGQQITETVLNAFEFGAEAVT